MKKIFLFAFAMLCSVMTFAQSANEDWRIHPDDAKYKIYGDFRTVFPDKGGVEFQLTNVRPEGLIFPVQHMYKGRKTNLGNVYFTFDRVTYQGPSDLLENIALWVYDEDLQQWVPDEETGKEKANATNVNEMTVMLVLDCSSSLSDQGFRDVKNSAKAFIDVMLASSKSGNIHIGIIGFSSRDQIQKLSLRPLTALSAEEMKSFVDGFRQGNGTALYRSFDEAFDMTTSYAKGLQKFSKAAVVTFTDGLDNGSINPQKKIGSREDYYKYITTDVLPRTINGVELDSYTIFVPGGADTKRPGVEAKIESQLRTMAKQDDHYFRVDNTSMLDAKFRSIAKSLIDNWKVLSCFISEGQNGHVCWTFGKKKVAPQAPRVPDPPKPAPKGNPLLIGGDIGLGLPIEFGGDPNSAEGAGLDFQLGFDFAYPLSDRFAIGFYFSIGGGFTGGGYYPGSGSYYDYFGGAFKFSTGLLMEMGDLNDRPFIFGLSPCLGFGFDYTSEYMPVELRFGRVFRNNVYVTGDLGMGIPVNGGSFVLEPAVRVGYNFGHNVKR